MENLEVILQETKKGSNLIINLNPLLSISLKKIPSHYELDIEVKKEDDDYTLRIFNTDRETARVSPYFSKKDGNINYEKEHFDSTISIDKLKELVEKYISFQDFYSAVIKLKEKSEENLTEEEISYLEKSLFNNLS